MLAAANTEAGKAQAAAIEAMLNSFDDETVAPLAGLSIRTERVVSAPDLQGVLLRVGCGAGLIVVGQAIFLCFLTLADR